MGKPVLLDTAGYPSDLVVVMVGVSLVFLILLLLTVIISLQGRFFDALEKKRAQKQKAAAPEVSFPVAAPAPVVEQGISPEVVAAIAAAVAFMGGGHYTLRTVSRAKEGRNAWSRAGVIRDTEPF